MTKVKLPYIIFPKRGDILKEYLVWLLAPIVYIILTLALGAIALSAFALQKIVIMYQDQIAAILVASFIPLAIITSQIHKHMENRKRVE